ncbi:unnamed protein product [Rotaria sp. Silwood2]|nr:unnamed protein product [Rotaria sp. Silwood2]
MKKAQKLTNIDKLTRVKCAKRLRKKFGVRKNCNKRKWNRVINCDFSRLFTLQSFHNKKNNAVCAAEGEEFEPDLIHAETDKFQKGILFWGAISA